MNRLTARKPSYFTRSAYGGVFAASTSGVNATAIVDTGIAVDQLASSSQAAAAGVFTQKVGVKTGSKFEGVKLDIPVVFTADSGQSITYSLTLKSSSASGGTYAAFATGNTVISNSTTATGVNGAPAPGTHVCGVATLSASLVGAKQFIRANCSRLGSAHDTGGAQLASNMLLSFFGGSLLPAS